MHEFYLLNMIYTYIYTIDVRMMGDGSKTLKERDN